MFSYAKFLLIAISLFLFSCSDSKKYEDVYSFSVNGCETGRHSFKAGSSKRLKEKLCEALGDNELNNFCAETLRYNRYISYGCQDTD